MSRSESTDAARPPFSPDTPLGAAPISRSTAQSNAQTQASTRGLTSEQAQRHVTQALDHWDSYWSRDPGRAHGPFN